MRIACVGWGSLVWSPRELPIRGGWRLDGPMLPIEFSRVSADGRVTLAVTRGARELQTLWIRLAVDSLAGAVRSLAAREKIPQPVDGSFPPTVGYWSRTEGDSGHAETAAVAAFARAAAVDAVVWTALAPGLSERTRGSVPDVDDLVAHLRGLAVDDLLRAEEYVRNAPAPIDTPNRRRFRERLGWHPSEVAYTACGLSRAGEP